MNPTAQRENEETDRKDGLPQDGSSQDDFPQGGGEMGELTRRYDWSRTPVGALENWPQSLRTVVSMLLNSKFPMFLWWGEELTQFYNDAYRPSLGNEGKHPMALGQKAVDCWPEIWAIIYPLIRQVLTTGESTWSEDQLVPIYRNGKIEDVYWTFSYSPVRGGTDKIEGVLVVCTETTEKVLIVKRLLASQTRFQNLVAGASVATAVLTGQHMVVELANATMLGIWEQDTSIIGKPLLEFLPELADQPFPQLLHNVLTSGEMYSAEDALVYTKRKGKLEPRYMNFSYKPLPNEEGQERSILVMATDVTERVLSRQRLAISERNLRNTIIKAPVAMCIFRGPQHVVEIANDRMIELWGRTASDVMSKPIFEGLPEARDQGFEQLLDGVFATGETFSAQGLPITLPRDGKIEMVYVNFVYEAYRETDGAITGVIAVAMDVTHQVVSRRQIEEVVAERTRELAEANKNLQKSNEELAQFAYIASHDLQEPVRKVSTFAQMLETSLGPIDAQSQKYLVKINSSAERMLALIRDVLAYSELSKTTGIFEPVDLQKTIESICMDFELLISQKEAIIRYTDLPVINAIPLQMSQLFSNLLSNALKFGRPGIAPVISITAKPLSREQAALHNLPDTSRQPDAQHNLLNGRHHLPGAGSLYYDIEVRDNGIGFRQSHAEQIFSIFQRLHGKTEYQGTGIGLAICKKVTQNHHGLIYAIGDPDQGATFHVILPGQPVMEG